MILTLDVGNSNVVVGLFNKDKLLASLRFSSSFYKTYDEWGLLFLQVLNYFKIEKKELDFVVISSVVPNLNNSLEIAISRYLGCRYKFLKDFDLSFFKSLVPVEVLGDDLLASAIGVLYRYYERNAYIILDFGTATTLTLLDKNNVLKGGVILPGLQLQIDALGSKTALLGFIKLAKPKGFISVNTNDAINNGIYWLNYGGLKFIIENIAKENNLKDYKVIATGGLSYLYKDKQLFDIYDQDLILYGLYYLYKKLN